MTYPLIGNYGRLRDDDQSERPVAPRASSSPTRRPRSSTTPASSRRCCARNGIPAIAGVDTRALARHLRANGCLRGVITEPGVTDHDAAVDLARAVPRWEDQDFVAQVSPSAVREVGDEAAEPLVAIVDFGLKANIVRSLRRRGVRVRVLPHTATRGRGARRRRQRRRALARARRPGAARRPGRARARGHRRRAAAAGDLPRPPDRRAGGRRRDDPAAVRPPRRQPPGPGPRHRLRPGDGAEPRGPGRRRLACPRRRGSG